MIVPIDSFACNVYIADSTVFMSIFVYPYIFRSTFKSSMMLKGYKATEISRKPSVTNVSIVYNDPLSTLLFIY